jgi:hypothetical protein
MIISLSIVSLGLIIIIVTFILKPYSNTLYRNLILGNFGFRIYCGLRRLLFRIPIFIILYFILKYLDISSQNLLTILIVLLLSWSFLFLEPLYRKKRATYWLSEVIFPARMRLGDSYTIKLRMRSKKVAIALGSTGPGIPIAAYVPYVVKINFDEEPQSTLPLKIRINAPGFDVEPKELELKLKNNKNTFWNSFIVFPKTGGNHKVSFEFLSNKRKINEINVAIKVKHFLLFSKFGLNDNQIRIMQFLGLLFAIIGSFIALLKAFNLF